MAKKTDFETASIVRRLLMFIPAFYACFFVVSVVALAGAQEPIAAQSVFYTPFNWRSFTPAASPAELSARSGGGGPGNLEAHFCDRAPHVSCVNP